MRLGRVDGVGMRVVECAGSAVLACMAAASGFAQSPNASVAGPVAPIAIVPLQSADSAHPDAAAKVTGALEVSAGKAVISSSGAISSGTQTTEVLLPHRGTLRVCANTTVKLAADHSVPAADTPAQIPGLMMALDHGAIEASFATGQNADLLLTPEFRILISGPGAVEVKVRLGQNGDTCVDNPGLQAPYVLVTSVFEEGAYRIQPGQRVMFQHGSLREVVDREKEPCGCPPAEAHGNEFPLAQSEGLTAQVAPVTGPQAGSPVQGSESLAYSGADHSVQGTSTATPVTAPTASSAVSTPAPPAKKPGLFAHVRSFLRRVFGAE